MFLMDNPVDKQTKQKLDTPELSMWRGIKISKVATVYHGQTCRRTDMAKTLCSRSINAEGHKNLQSGLSFSWTNL